MNEQDYGVAAIILLAITAIGGVGFKIGEYYAELKAKEEFQKKAIEIGVGRYNPQTANFELYKPCTKKGGSHE
jgi:hypothetical protein